MTIELEKLNSVHNSSWASLQARKSCSLRAGKPFLESLITNFCRGLFGLHRESGASILLLTPDAMKVSVSCSCPSRVWDNSLHQVRETDVTRMSEILEEASKSVEGSLSECRMLLVDTVG